MGFREENLDEDDEAGKYRSRPRRAYLIGDDKPVDIPARRVAPKPSGEASSYTRACRYCGEKIQLRRKLDGRWGAFSMPPSESRHQCARAPRTNGEEFVLPPDLEVDGIEAFESGLRQAPRPPAAKHPAADTADRGRTTASLPSKAMSSDGVPGVAIGTGQAGDRQVEPAILEQAAQAAYSETTVVGSRPGDDTPSNVPRHSQWTGLIWLATWLVIAFGLLVLGT